MNGNDRGPGETTTVACPGDVEIDSEAIFNERAAVVIVHGERRYRLEDSCHGRLELLEVHHEG